MLVPVRCWQAKMRVSRLVSGDGGLAGPSQKARNRRRPAMCLAMVEGLRSRSMVVNALVRASGSMEARRVDKSG